MKIIGILVEAADGSQHVVANERLVSASDPRLAEMIPLERLGTRMCSAFRAACVNTYGDAVRRSRQALEYEPNVARKAINGLRELLAERDLQLDMIVVEVT